MSKYKAEDKAREYSKKKCAESCRTQCEVYDSCTIFKERIRNYTAGYNQAITDFSASQVELSGALRDLVIAFEDLDSTPTDYRNSLDQAKQLLTPNTQEDEKDKI